ncbi:MAG: hypothetical protein LKE88_00720 [Acidaminococcus provencensis]|jgi:hypothetical protein|uniref:hypothetical protein n=1 Tax=Acidaminococcus provencensis TaxID=2058289 RepID=UPI0023F1631C|nr:hypothetical protein [Acidaminococcus provencensis]MCH4095163.1 hypothetical protein [Acidaminococcus provencensis]
MTTFGTALNVLSAFFNEMNFVNTRRQILVKSEQFGEVIIPVTPEKYQMTGGQKNKVVDITRVGEAIIFGMPKARTLTFSSFFPDLNHDYPFAVDSTKSPTELVEYFIKVKEARKPVRVIITDSPVNLMMGLMSFNYFEKDGTRDIYYELSFTEYKDLNIPSANNNKPVDEKTGLKKRPEGETPKKVTWQKKAGDFLDATKKAYGDYNHWRRVAKSNNLSSLIINNAGKIGRMVGKKL